MTGLTLPAALSAALPSIAYPLGPTSCPPMYYESLEKMKPIRENSELPQPINDPVVQELRGSLEKLFPKPPFQSSFSLPEQSGFPGPNEECRQFGLVAMALLFLGHGLTDEAHDLVTPLSWPEDTHFGYGPSIYSYVTPAAQSYATYVHSLVHRREGFNVGEFGMAGFSNANYWSNVMLESPGFYSLPHAAIIQKIKQLGYECIGSPGVKEWCRQNDLFELTDDSFFNTRAINTLCSDVIKGNTNTGLREFAEGVVEIEIRILLAHALYFAGYDFKSSEVLPWAAVPVEETKEKETTAITAVPVAQTIEEETTTITVPVEVTKEEETTTPTTVNNGATVVTQEKKILSPSMDISIDEKDALAAARRVYPALLSQFLNTGSVTIRSLLKKDRLPVSVAAGIACRLLQCQACRPGSSDVSSDERSIRILLPSTPEEAASISTKGTAIKRSLSSGDLYATRKTDGDELDGAWYTFVACDASDKRACYVDKSFGTRGETSKATNASVSSKQ